MTASSELEDLETLLASPGWQAFVTLAQHEWGPAAYRQRAQQILASLNLASGAEASTLILQLESAAREVERLLAMPLERVKKLRARGGEK